MSIFKKLDIDVGDGRWRRKLSVNNTFFVYLNYFVNLVLVSVYNVNMDLQEKRVCIDIHHHIGQEASLPC